MTDAPQGYAPVPPAYESDRTGWTGWITFAAIMMIIAGALNAIYGLIAVINDEWVVWGIEDRCTSTSPSGDGCTSWSASSSSSRASASSAAR